MKAQCPQCGFEGNVRDDLIPEGGRNISCPNCKKIFFVRKGGVPGNVPPPDTKVTAPLRAAPAPSASPASAPRKTNPLLIVAMAVLFAALGFYGGYQYRGLVQGKPAAPTKVEKPKKTPRKLPSTIETKGNLSPLLTPMATPEATIPPGKPEKSTKPGAEKSFTAEELFGTFSTMPPGQVNTFCRNNSTADVNGSGTIREIKKTSTSGSTIADYSIRVEYGKDTWVVLDSKMTGSYLSNFKVGNKVSFTGLLKDYKAAGKQKTIYLADGMIIVK